MAMDLPTLVQTCAPNVGPTTMHAIIRTESGGNPWALGDNTAALPRKPATKAEAVAMAKALIALGHSVDMGLGQVNSKNLPALGLTVDQVFEPCTNLRASAAILESGYRRAVTVHGPGQPALLAALSTYNTGNLTAGFANGYVQRVAANAGVHVELSVPSLAAGSVMRGKRASVTIKADGSLAPTGVAQWGSRRVAAVVPVAPAAERPETIGTSVQGFGPSALR